MSCYDVTWAKFSPCRTWRYALYRGWDYFNILRGNVAFIGLNPSTADETKDDPTVRRCVNYAKVWGYGGMLMLNIFAFRATDPKEMKASLDPIGPENEKFLRLYHELAALTVACWGTHGAYLSRGAEVVNMLDHLACFGITKAGHPKHPLYLRADLTPQSFT